MVRKQKKQVMFYIGVALTLSTLGINWYIGTQDPPMCEYAGQEYAVGSYVGQGCHCESIEGEATLIC